MEMIILIKRKFKSLITATTKKKCNNHIRNQLMNWLKINMAKLLFMVAIFNPTHQQECFKWILIIGPVFFRTSLPNIFLKKSNILDQKKKWHTCHTIEYFLNQTFTILKFPFLFYQKWKWSFVFYMKSQSFIAFFLSLSLSFARSVK